MASLFYQAWQSLTQGSSVDIIAPAGGCAANTIEQVENLLHSWQLIPRISPDLLGADLLCANSDAARFKQLQNALFNPESHAIWCLRGGYGCTRLIPDLLKLPIPKVNKLFIGFSDITTLHLFLQQQWHWQTLHGPSANQVAQQTIDAASIQEFKKLIFGKLPQLAFSLTPLNCSATKTTTSITSCVIGGTLTLIQASLATPWQIAAQNKILFLEEVNEAAYRIDRMLQHLQQSGTLQGVKAILFGDFIAPKTANDSELTQAVLKRFAQEQNFPVFHCPDIGHGKTNRSLPFGAQTELNPNNKQLIITLK
jgi:muramoyltetrapeptide carboxypeptidase